MPLYPDTGEHERMQRSSRKSQRAPLISVSSNGSMERKTSDSSPPLVVLPHVPHSTRAKPNRSSSFASGIVMIFIVILTFVLLLSGVYLASAMGIINVPWFTDAPVSAQPVPAQGIAVPDVIGLNYVQASQVAVAHGFVLKVVAGPMKGSVTRQYPMPGTWAAKGSSLLVDLAAP